MQRLCSRSMGMSQPLFPQLHSLPVSGVKTTTLLCVQLEQPQHQCSQTMTIIQSDMCKTQADAEHYGLLLPAGPWCCKAVWSIHMYRINLTIQLDALITYSCCISKLFVRIILCIKPLFPCVSHNRMLVIQSLPNLSLYVTGSESYFFCCLSLSFRSS